MDVGNKWNHDGLKPCYPVRPCPACGEYPKLTKRHTKDGLAFAFSHYCDDVAHYCESMEQEKAAELWNNIIERIDAESAQMKLF